MSRSERRLAGDPPGALETPCREATRALLPCHPHLPAMLFSRPLRRSKIRSYNLFVNAVPRTPAITEEVRKTVEDEHQRERPGSPCRRALGGHTRPDSPDAYFSPREQPSSFHSRTFGGDRRQPPRGARVDGPKPSAQQACADPAGSKILRLDSDEPQVAIVLPTVSSRPRIISRTR